jgi:hypothetical protein
VYKFALKVAISVPVKDGETTASVINILYLNILIYENRSLGPKQYSQFFGDGVGSIEWANKVCFLPEPVGRVVFEI